MPNPTHPKASEQTHDIARRLGMVQWYDPGQLFRTGIEVAVSTLFGRHSDSRRLDAISRDASLFDYRDDQCLDEDGSFGFDFIADTGDGWNSTYAVALALSLPSFKPSDQSPLPRGRLLVFGGDLVYPYPTKNLYEQRLVAPYTLAGQLQEGKEGDVLAIPGNHDWYDSLVNFRRIFCHGRKFASSRTLQSRSYFAARLPGNWYLFGVDIQLDGDIDELQFDYFSDIVKKLEENVSVILCIPEPIWQQRWVQTDTPSLIPSLLETLEQEIGEKLRLTIAGDLHHYQRHSSGTDKHFVTCGTGGAFLHPTHQTPVDPTGEFEHQVSFPDKSTSRKLTYRNFAFPFLNPLFGSVPAVGYLLTAWQNGLAVGECFGKICIAEMGFLGLSHWQEAVYAGLHSAILNPIGIFLYGVIFFGFVFFADKRSAQFRYSVGTVHALAHIIAGFLIYWAGAYAAITLFELAPKSIGQYMLAGFIIFTLSWVVGSVILGIYLFVSLNIFGMHQNEAFSSLGIQDWKGFLRFRIKKDGALEMRFIGIKKVPRKWSKVTSDSDLQTALRSDACSISGEVIDQISIPPTNMQSNS